ncbi:hypothetical protein JMA_40390 (plasmid) [Jeotgalibacillus malaysiensis]|uniref:DUF2157 domain-containing protein n=1 Tax=Jeotgalibacillus malaysiensis TaxID=1508404 RepID=A0A0B5AXF5_9BACL|nr:DUF2157 domain-containing protein [Jeotgalibacillus malaysiensis]AJD93357.1 hypothetical protein JMA_40390 [Jeotgalibacillus malaysiensis]
MGKRKVTKNQYEWQRKEVRSFQESGVISSEQGERMLQQYEVKKEQSVFLRFVLMFGAILLGLGVLSFIASNWSEMSNGFKYFVLLSGMIGFFGVGWKFEEHSPKTARSLHIVGILVFGASIFLIGQMFHLGGDFYGAFLAWGIGSIGIGYVLKDRLIIIFSTILFMIYAIGFSGDNLKFPFVALVVLMGLVAINHRLGYSRVLTAMNFVFAWLLGVISVSLTLYKTDNIEEHFVFIFLFGFLFGLSLLYMKVPVHVQSIVRMQGHLTHGLNGFILTFGDVWQSTEWAIGFSILYILYAFYLLKQGSLFSILLISALVIRFYIDLSFDFMPKSLVFIIAGVMLLVTGYIFEKKRKEGGEKDEKESV